MKALLFVLFTFCPSLFVSAETGEKKERSPELRQLDQEIAEQKEIVRKTKEAKKIFLENRDEFSLVPYRLNESDGSGLKVTKIKPGSFWANLRIELNDVLLEIDGQRLNPYDLPKIIDIKKSPRTHSIKLLRGDRKITIKTK